MIELLIICAIVSFYFFIKKVNSFWRKKQVPCLKPSPIVGNIGPFLTGKLSLAELIVKFYTAHQDKRYVGIHSFLEPVLVVNDVDLIKQIAIKDFDHFVDRRTFVSEETDPLFGKSLFSLRGQKWKNMRSTLTPAFSSSKMRSIFVLISEKAEQFTQHLSTRIDSKNITTLEMKDLFTRFANDVIATSAFGIQCDSLENRNNEFYLMGQRTIFDGFLDSLKLFGYTLSPALMKFFSVRLFSKTVSNFFKDIVLSTIKVREEQGIVRPDMIHLMMEARTGKLSDKKENVTEMSNDDIASQAIFFFFAGFETTSTLLCHMANELAINVEIQKKLQKEIDEVIEKHGEKVSYETLLEMQYLDMVINETLRKWPTVPVVDRKCVKTYSIDPINLVENSVTLEKGDNVWFPIFALHRDPQYFPDPEKFDPERFNSENKNNIKQFSYLPFGLGPRNCIGARFALMETKIVYFYLLSKFDLMVVEKTQIPLKIKKFQFNIHAEKGFWIGFKRRNNEYTK